MACLKQVGAFESMPLVVLLFCLSASAARLTTSAGRAAAAAEAKQAILERQERQERERQQRMQAAAAASSAALTARSQSAPRERAQVGPMGLVMRVFPHPLLLRRIRTRTRKWTMRH